jgi:hypothetical protein
MGKRVIVVGLAAALLGGSAPPALAAFVGKREARTYVVRVVPAGAPRVMLRDGRSAFFRTERLWVQPSSGCDRRAAEVVSCRVVARLVPDAVHRKANWWPIDCRGAVRVARLGNGSLEARQLNYLCRTVRP